MLKNNIFSLHIDSTGLIRLGDSVGEIFQNFENIINKDFVENNSTVLIPTYSYNYIDGKVYDLKKSPSKLDMRQNIYEKKTNR